MSTRPFRSALAFTCTSLLVAAGALAQDAAPAAQRAVELELELARTKDVYLVVDPESRRFEVRSRGLVLDVAPLEAVTVKALVPLFGPGSRPEIELPAVWHVTEPPADTWRRVIAPPELRPYTEDEEEEPTPAPDAGPPPTRTPTPTPVEVPPDYTLTVDAGWQVEVTTEAPLGFGGRLAGAVASGWQRLKGAEPGVEPTRLVLTMTADDARRVRHLFQPGMAILLAAVGSSPGPA